MKYSDYIGLASLVISSIIISFANDAQKAIFKNGDYSQSKDPITIAAWVPVVFSIYVSLNSSFEVLLSSHAVNKLGLNALDLSFYRCFIAGVLAGIGSFIYFFYIDVNWMFLLYGTIATVLLGLAKVMWVMAINRGPSGPVTAIVMSTGVIVFTIA